MDTNKLLSELTVGEFIDLLKKGNSKDISNCNAQIEKVSQLMKDNFIEDETNFMTTTQINEALGGGFYHRTLGQAIIRAGFFRKQKRGIGYGFFIRKK